MLNFDHNGNLRPYEAINTTMEEVKLVLVDDFPITSTRIGLFDVLTIFLAELKVFFPNEIILFINGSFVTRKFNPNDIDCVIFLDYKIFDIQEKQIQNWKKYYKPLGIDAYFEKSYPETHEFYGRFNSDLMYWNDLFSKDRKKQPKGYLTISL